MRQCLVIAPSYADLSLLRLILEELEAEVTNTTELLVGAQLAKVDLGEFDFVVAMLPSTGPDGSPTGVPPAIYLEMGIILGRGLPLFVIAESPDQVARLGDFANHLWVEKGTPSRESIRLHLDLFIKVAASRKTSSPEPRSTPIPASQASAAESMAKTMAGIPRVGAETVRLLNSIGASVEIYVATNPDDEYSVALIPGAADILGPVLFEAVTMLRGRGLKEAHQMFVTKVRRRGTQIGLLVYSGPNQESPKGFDPVVVLHIEELQKEVEQGVLPRTLIRARNAIVHGLPGEV